MLDALGLILAAEHRDTLRGISVCVSCRHLVSVFRIFFNEKLYRSHKS